MNGADEGGEGWGGGLFDTHCHLNHPAFEGDLAETVARARAAGVGRFLVIGYDLDSSGKAAELARPEDGLLAAVGIHPHDAESWNAAAERQVRLLAARPGVVALGEIGLDFYRDLSPRAAQYAALRGQLELAAELGLPIVVHTRDSVTPALDELEPYARAGLAGIMHCWSGTPEEARRARELGFLLGIGGVLTYRNPGALPEVVAESPDESLVFETDAPYLPPVPHRGQRNEPAHLPLVVARAAALRGAAPAALIAASSRAAGRLLGLPERTGAAE